MIATGEMLELLTFTLDEVRYAIPHTRVVEVVPRVRVVPLPAAPVVVVGLVAFRGELAAAVDLRARLGHPSRAPSMDDHFVIARTARRLVALIVDRADALLDVPTARIQQPAVDSAHITGVAVQPDGMVLIDDLDALLSLDEERTLDAALIARSGES